MRKGLEAVCNGTHPHASLDPTECLPRTWMRLTSSRRYSRTSVATWSLRLRPVLCDCAPFTHAMVREPQTRKRSDVRLQRRHCVSLSYFISWGFVGLLYFSRAARWPSAARNL